jgi:hypothetical protein
MKKKVTSKKTPSGYKIEVWVENGKHVKPLLKVIERYFNFAEDLLNPQRRFSNKYKTEEIVEKIKEAKVVR